MTTREKADSAVAHLTHVVAMAEDAVARMNRKVDKAKAHLAQAAEGKLDAEAALVLARADLAEWVAAAAAFDTDSAPATAHDAGVRIESSN